VKLPLAEPDEVEPPHADHVKAVGWLLSPDYLLGLLVLDATGLPRQVRIAGRACPGRELGDGRC
jgi:hypothetical protein